MLSLNSNRMLLEY